MSLTDGGITIQKQHMTVRYKILSLINQNQHFYINNQLVINADEESIGSGIPEITGAAQKQQS